MNYIFQSCYGLKSLLLFIQLYYKVGLFVIGIKKIIGKRVSKCKRKKKKKRLGKRVAKGKTRLILKFSFRQISVC